MTVRLELIYYQNMNQEWNHSKEQYNHFDKNFKRHWQDLNNGERNIIRIAQKLIDYKDY